MSAHRNPVQAGSRRFAFPKGDRLRQAAAFRAVYGAGVSRRVGPLVISTRPNGLGRLRLGLSVGRTAGGAVVRNRIKRRLREAFRLERAELPPGYDVVITVRRHLPLAVRVYRRHLSEVLVRLDRTWSKKLENPSRPPPSSA